MMYQIPDKDTVEAGIVTHIPTAAKGSFPRTPIAQSINDILYELKTGVHWQLLPA